MRSNKDADYYRVFALRTIGNFLILSSIFMIAKTFYQPVREEIRYLYEKQTKKEYIVASNQKEAEMIIKRDFGSDIQKGALKEALEKNNIGLLIPADPQFSIVIPKIAANSRVVSNVDAGDKDEYLTILKSGVAHALGSTFPGEGGHVYLFAHSTDYIWNAGTYNAVFYLLYKLEIGDEVNIFFKGQRFTYLVTGKEIVNPDKVEYITRKTDREFVTLQTCWPPGTTLQRQLIFAERQVE